eukprot:SAG25_NODE_1008_length_4323_cov_5.595206_2_plen_142_part_00
MILKAVCLQDPVLTAEYATSYVGGMQQIKTGKNGKPYLKMLSYLLIVNDNVSLSVCVACTGDRRLPLDQHWPRRSQQHVRTRRGGVRCRAARHGPAQKQWRAAAGRCGAQACRRGIADMARPTYDMWAVVWYYTNIQLPKI